MVETDVRIGFRKISDARHALEITRRDGKQERMECETRSYLLHDLLHYAVEREARLDNGFWGALSQGRTLAQMNDRSADADGRARELQAIEQLVGALSRAGKGLAAPEVFLALKRAEAALDGGLPAWLTEEFIVKVQARLRRLNGHWRATPYGSVMELDW